MDNVTDDQVKKVCCITPQNRASANLRFSKAAKALLEGKASVSTVGDLYVLPFADEIGLNA